MLPSTKPAPWGLLMRNPPPWRWAGGGQRNRPRGGRALKVEGLGLSVECQFSLNSQHSSLNIPAASTRLFCPLEEWVLCGRIADWVCLRRLHAKKGWTPEIHPFHRRFNVLINQLCPTIPEHPKLHLQNLSGLLHCSLQDRAAGIRAGCSRYS